MQQNTLLLGSWDYWYFAVLMTVGAFTHFTFQILGKPFWAGLLFPTNESTFQHLKMLILPSAIFFTVQFFMRETNNFGFFLSRFVAVLIGMIGICIFFYTYSGIIGDNYLPLDILSFAFGVAITVLAYTFLDSYAIFDFKYSNALGVFCFYLLIAITALATVYPPEIGLFYDPATKSYAPLSAVAK